MREPNTEIAKIIYDHLPPFGGTIDENSHIAMTTDVTGPGLFVIKEFAEKAQVDVEPVRYPSNRPRYT